MADKLGSFITRFRKSHGRQYSLIVTSRKCKYSIDEGEYFSALSMDFEWKPRSNVCKIEGI